MPGELSSNPRNGSTLGRPAEVRGVIFDGDDTLWLTESLYDEARRRAREVVERAGIDGSEWERIQRERDISNVELFGHNAERFPTSCVEAFLLLNGAEVADRGVVER